MFWVYAAVMVASAVMEASAAQEEGQAKSSQLRIQAAGAEVEAFGAETDADLAKLNATEDENKRRQKMKYALSAGRADAAQGGVAAQFSQSFASIQGATARAGQSDIQTISIRGDIQEKRFKSQARLLHMDAMNFRNAAARAKSQGDNAWKGIALKTAGSLVGGYMMMGAGAPAAAGGNATGFGNVAGMDGVANPIQQGFGSGRF